jgi:peptidoglycan/xylan/chitin deacetylase (PgdA/CDA1 family)
MRSTWLMYHDVHAVAPRRDTSSAAAVYHVSRARFAEHLAAIRASGLRVITAREFALGCEDDSVVLTFDDGWRGACEIAPAMLEERGWAATFYITRDHLGQPHFARPESIHEASRGGMEIGVHGTTHRSLSGCSRSEILHELVACKDHLESLLGRPVTSASLPGSDWSRRVVECTQAAGLTTLSTSRPGVNRPDTSPFELRRITVRSSTSGEDVARFCRFQVNRELARWAALGVLRRLLRPEAYQAARRMALERRPTQS